MAPNNNTKSIDTMLKELDDIFISHYLGCEDRNEPYKEIISAVGVFKNAREKDDLLIAIQNKFDSKETFLNLESNLWGTLFIIIGLFVTMCSDLILSNYEKLPFFNSLPTIVYALFAIIVTSTLILLFCHSIGSSKRKSREKCYYKFVYDILNR